ncbi:hypothetical protein M8J75_001284 [Diaphorina citri]|nr:hypothetical protein M8J75_001284 [Diaphorina citri]KAI5753867.1 hypothetical protein M8J77_003953 [Diaphorina citri]
MEFGIHLTSVCREPCELLHGSFYHNIPGNGDRGFHALSLGLFGDFHSGQKLRDEAVGLILERWNDPDMNDVRRMLHQVDESRVCDTLEMYRTHVTGKVDYCGLAEVAAVAYLYQRRIIVITVQSNTEASVSMDVGYSEDPSPIYLRRADDSYDVYVSKPQGTLIISSESQVMLTNSADPEVEVNTDTLGEYIHDEPLDSELMIRVGSEIQQHHQHVPDLPPWEVRKRPSLRLDQHPTTLSRYHSKGIMEGNIQFGKIKEHSLGKADYECKHCGAVFWPSQLSIESKQTARCCDYGKVTLDPINGKFKTTQGAEGKEILALLDGTHKKSKHFHQYILAYNRIFSTVFSTGKFQFLGSNRLTSHVYSMKGEIKFRTEAYEKNIIRRTADGKFVKIPNTINHGHLYFLAITDETILARVTNSTLADKLDIEIVRLLEKYLRSNSRVIKWFEYTRQVYEEEKCKAAQAHRPVQDVVLVINPREPNTDLRKMESTSYKQGMFGSAMQTPINDYVAAVITGKVNDYKYDFQFYPRGRTTGERTYQPHIANRTIDTHMFPIFYLHGEDCWGYRTQAINRNTPPKLLTLQEYAKYRIARRKDISPLHQGQKLFLNWLIHQQIRIEYDRLEFFRLNQEELRLDKYRSKKDFVTRQAKAQNKNVGKMVIMPPSFENTTRHRRKNFHDFMTIMSMFGKPAWFITFTTNPRWSEIIERCEEQNCDPRFSPDIVNDVFYEKWLSFHSDLTCHQMFGKVKAWFTVFEAQSTLLMHAHNIYIMNDVDIPYTSDQINNLVWAHLPDPETQPELLAKVQKLYIHGPCHLPRGGGMTWSCRSNSQKCRFNYPRPYSNTSSICDGKITYRRPNDGRVCMKQVGNQMVKLDNRWVVPYNPIMVMRYNCHIDFEVLPNFAVARYLAKYCTKTAQTEAEHITRKNSQNSKSANFDWDEIQAYKEMRVLGAPEAHFRLMGHSYTQKSVCVKKLPVHLEGEDVPYDSDEEDASTEVKVSQLVAYFNLMKDKPSKKHLYYVDIVQTHNFEGGKWIETKRINISIGRMTVETPSSHTMERYYLRMLLSNRPGCDSYESVRTIDNVCYNTYKAACLALGIIEHEREVYLCLDEIKTNLSSGHLLRQTFVIILKYAHFEDPRELWSTFSDDFAEDYFHLSQNRTEAIKRSLKSIESMLIHNRSTLSLFNLPNPDTFVHPNDQNSSLQLDPQRLDQHEPYETTEQHLDRIASDILTLQLNGEQQSFVNKVFLSLSNNNAEKLFFLCAAAGTGKTCVINHIAAKCHQVRTPSRSIACTQVSALLIFNGRTSHQTFGFPLDKVCRYTRDLEINEDQRSDLADVKIILWDECSMIYSWQLQLVDRLLRQLKNNDNPFGGIVVILSGDLRQFPPDVKGGNDSEMLAKSFVSSKLYNQFQTETLTKNMRTGPNEQEYEQWILDVGEGRANIPYTSDIDIPAHYIIPTFKNLKEFVFQKFVDLEQRVSVILTPTQAGADRINREILLMFKSKDPVIPYLSATSLVHTGRFGKRSQVEDSRYLESLSCETLPCHRLELKIGVPVLLMRDIDIQLGLCTGTRLIVVQLLKHSILCKIASGQFKDNLHYIPRIVFQVEQLGLSGTLRRVQYPLTLAFAVPISNIQAHTVDGRCGIYLDRAPFHHGMLYVAVSRVTNGKLLRICVEDAHKQGRKFKGVGGDASRRRQKYTQNIVHEKILGHIPNFI